MAQVPDEVAALVAERERARDAKDWASADALRDRIEALGYVVRDGADGATVEPKPPYEVVDPGSVSSVLGEPAALALSIHLLHEGYPDDLERFLSSFAAHHAADSSVEIVVVDNGSGDGERIEALVASHPSARALHLDRTVGWGAARNAGLKTSRGELVALVDLSIEPTGDVLTPLTAAFDDPAVAVVGPFGLVTDDMRDFRETAGPDADVIEGYWLVTRRGLLQAELIREKFRWYRNADLDLSLQLRDAAGGGPARVIDLPVVKHQHRGWSTLDEEERAVRSRKNHSIFYGRWRGRADLLTREARGQ